ncbi:MAG: RNA methyltransferase [Flavobacteriales bacterium]|nr:RNA methyltransferase [Flavobacteriales bacterium]
MDISSLKNPRVKQLVDLEKPRERRKQGLFVVEGVREVSLGLQSGHPLRSLFICPSFYQLDNAYPIEQSGAEVFHLSEEVFAKVAVREGTGGVIALLESREYGLDNLIETESPLYLILEKVEKPGNIGAMLRTADAAGLSGVIVCDPATDFYNPNVIRSSVGCVFTVPVACASNDEVLAWLRKRHIRSYAAALTDTATPYHHHDFKIPSAILLGSEADGLSDFWLRNSDEQVIIPMRGRIDSMNVSNAAAVLVFEALRQRGL